MNCKNDTDKTWTVYAHTNLTNGKRYIGITSKSPEKRWKNGNGYKCGSFQNAIKKYGWDGFVHEILFTNLSEEEAKDMEIKLIAEYNTMDNRFGYNLTPGGDSCPISFHSEEVIKKSAESRTGRKHSDETKRKMSLAAMGNKRWLGKHHKEESKRKMSEIMKNYYANKEFTDEEREALSKRAKQAYIDHPDLRQRLSEARKKYCKEHSEAMEEFSKQKIEYYKNHPEVREKLAKPHEKPVDMLTKDMKFIKTFDSLTKAMNETGVDRSSIARTCKGKQHTAGGYVWAYHNHD